MRRPSGETAGSVSPGRSSGISTCHVPSVRTACGRRRARRDNGRKWRLRMRARPRRRLPLPASSEVANAAAVACRRCRVMVTAWEAVTAEATMARRAGVPEWPKGAGCKPAGSAFGGSNPPPCMVAGETAFPPRAPSLCATTALPVWTSRRVKPGSGRGTGVTLRCLALLAQSVEHLHGKEGVDGSSPSEGSKIPAKRGFLLPRVVQLNTSSSRRGRTSEPHQLVTGPERS